MDIVTKETRSKLMGKIKSKDTKPELFLRHELWHSGIRYRKNYTDIPGSPDLFIPKYKTAIFIHGCFWHFHQDNNCKLAHIPKTNIDFWKRKIQNNISRDKKNNLELINSCIQVIIVWECTVYKMMRDPVQKEDILTKIIYSIKYGEELYYEF